MIAVLFLDDGHELSALCKAFLERRGELKVDAVATVREAVRVEARKTGSVPA